MSSVTNIIYVEENVYVCFTCGYQQQHFLCACSTSFRATDRAVCIQTPAINVNLIRFGKKNLKSSRFPISLDKYDNSDFACGFVFNLDYFYISIKM